MPTYEVTRVVTRSIIVEADDVNDAKIVAENSDDDLWEESYDGDDDQVVEQE